MDETVAGIKSTWIEMLDFGGMVSCDGMTSNWRSRNWPSPRTRSRNSMGISDVL